MRLFGPTFNHIIITPYLDSSQVLAEMKGLMNTTLRYVLHDLTDGGDYYCSAVNTAGSVSKKATIKMKSKFQKSEF